MEHEGVHSTNHSVCAQWECTFSNQEVKRGQQHYIEGRAERINEDTRTGQPMSTTSVSSVGTMTTTSSRENSQLLVCLLFLRWVHNLPRPRRWLGRRAAFLRVACWYVIIPPLHSSPSPCRVSTSMGPGRLSGTTKVTDKGREREESPRAQENGLCCVCDDEC